MIKNLIISIWISLTLCFAASNVYGYDGLGQTIQITTRFDHVIGKPSLLLVIRDLDHGLNIPYLFDIRQGENFWVAFTYSRNYVIAAANLRIPTYRPRVNKYRLYEINNFCNLESQGRINRGESIFVTIKGDLAPCSYTCDVSKYPDTNFTIVNQES